MNYEKIFSLLEEKNLNYEDVCVDLDSLQKGQIFLLLKDDDDAEPKIRLALKKGAKCVLASKSFGVDNCFEIEKPRAFWAIVEKKKHHDAVDKMKVIAVTGTNGKTTTTHIIYQILKEAGEKVALIGTLGAFFDQKHIETNLTTPDPDLLHKLFEDFYNAGARYVVMEASAHALELDKLAGINFEVAVLTNITQDHLDFFGDMQHYQNAKLKLFQPNVSKKAALCVDSVDVKKILNNLEIPYITCGLNSPSDVFGAIENESIDGSIVLCNAKGVPFLFQLPLVGRYNVENCLAAIAVCNELGIDKKCVQSALKHMGEIEGRFNVVKGAGKTVVIDFAHTPDGLEKIIHTARPFAKGKVLTVFGCGGNRDAKKRPIMGKIASSLSDAVVLTSDNPRFEDPMEIISQIAEGVEVGKDVLVEPDRAKAIKVAINLAEKNDVVIIAGKGGEKYQDINGIKVPYDDLSVVQETFFEIKEAEHLKGETKSAIKC